MCSCIFVARAMTIKMDLGTTFGLLGNLYGTRPQDLAVQNSRVEGCAWTWAVQGPSGGCAVAV